jgi:hypothetical protein
MNGLVWSGLVWCGVVWCGVVWCGVQKCHQQSLLVLKNSGNTSVLVLVLYCMVYIMFLSSYIETEDLLWTDSTTTHSIPILERIRKPSLILVPTVPYHRICSKNYFCHSDVLYLVLLLVLFLVIVIVIVIL